MAGHKCIAERSTGIMFGRNQARELVAARDDLNALARRVQLLEDIEAIRALHSKYHDYVDIGWDGKLVNPQGLREVFTEDIFFRWSAGEPEESPGHRGVENVITMLEESTTVWEMAMHSLLNEQIFVIGDTASCTRNDWVATRAADGRNIWFLKGFSNYTRTRDGWRIQTVALRFAGKMFP